MTKGDVFQRIFGVLDRTGIPHMLTGSFASSYHGSPRATQDIDVVISSTAQQIRALVALLPDSDYYVDEGAALEAQRIEGQFNIVDLATGWKIDLIVRKSRPFSISEFNRREIVDFQGIKLAIATAEDVLLAKLEWAKLGESRRQIDDAVGILRIRSGQLDLSYIHLWVEELNLMEQWNEACRISGVAEGS